MRFTSMADFTWRSNLEEALAAESGSDIQMPAGSNPEDLTNPGGVRAFRTPLLPISTADALISETSMIVVDTTTISRCAS